MKKQQTKTVSQNPFQDEATRNQSPRWLKSGEKAGKEEVPTGEGPRPLVDAKLVEAPAGSEGREGISGEPEPEFEDEPAN